MTQSDWQDISESHEKEVLVQKNYVMQNIRPATISLSHVHFQDIYNS